MKSEKKIDPKHREIRRVLRVIGPLIAIIGLALIAVAFISVISHSSTPSSLRFGTFGPPRYFWCGFLGLPLLAIGIAITKYAFMGAVTRYIAGEVAPVAKDTFNYVAGETSESVKTIAKAVGQGLAAGAPDAKAKTVVRCHKCNKENPIDAKFCNDCGTALAKTKACPRCGELNDPDAKFCDNCGGHLG